MTDLSGSESNKVFGSSAVLEAPYYYIDAYLDLSQVVLPLSGETTLYFNKDNNFNYLDPLQSASYAGFYSIESNVVIGEVVVYSNPGLASTVTNLRFNVGGAPDTTGLNGVSETWGGKTGYTAGLLQLEDINTGSICYYGHEGANFNAQEGKFLAVTITGDVPLALSSDPAKSKKLQRALRKGVRATRLVADPALSAGILHVVVKVYPKFQ